MQALLNINDYVVDELMVKGNPVFRKSEKEQKGQLDIALNFRRGDKAPRSFMISMIIEISKSKDARANYPYFLYLKIDGFFVFSEKADEATMQKMIGLNGVSVLFGIARGVVAQATANGAHGKFILPTINFVEMIKRSGKKSSRKPKRKKGPNMPA